MPSKFGRRKKDKKGRCCKDAESSNYAVKTCCNNKKNCSKQEKTYVEFVQRGSKCHKSKEIVSVKRSAC